MNANTASNQSGAFRCLRSFAASVLLGLGLLAFSPSPSRALTATGATKTTCVLVYYPNGTKGWVMRVDPPDVQNFKLTVTFDPARAVVDSNPGAGVIFKTPFNGSVDFSQANTGTLVITGNTAQANVTPGDVDTFEIVFDDLQPGSPINNAVFTVGGIGATDFIQTFDPSTMTPGNIPSAQIGTTSRAVTPGVASLIWDPDATYNNGTTGGGGTWDLSSATRFDALPSTVLGMQPQLLANVSWSNTTNMHDIAVFGGNNTVNSLVTVTSINAGGLQFDMPGYQLSGGTLTLSAPNGFVPTIEIREGAATINTALAGSAFTKLGPGTLILGGPNTFTGTTTISAGALQISSDQNLGTAPASATAGSLVLNGGTLRVTGTMTLSTNRGVNLTASGGTIDVASGILMYAGMIDGPGTLTKVGGGTLTFSGSNIFIGATTITAGTLINNGSLLSGVNVNSGILSGSGSIGGVVVVGDGIGGAGDAILRPASAGVPTTMPIGGLSLNSDALFQLTLNSTNQLADQLFVNGNATLGNGVAQLNATDVGSTSLPLGTTFTIIRNQSATTTGFFNSLPNGSTFTAGPNKYEIDYNVGPTSNNVQVKVVPEPDTIALLVSALLIAGSARRRFQK